MILITYFLGWPETEVILLWKIAGKYEEAKSNPTSVDDNYKKNASTVRRKLLKYLKSGCDHLLKYDVKFIMIL